MQDERRSPGTTALLAAMYLFLFGATLSLLRFAGRGWVGSVVGALILAGAFFTLLSLPPRRGRRRG